MGYYFNVPFSLHDVVAYVFIFYEVDGQSTEYYYFVELQDTEQQKQWI